MARLAVVLVALVGWGCVPFGAFKLVDSSVLTNAYRAEPQAAEDVRVFISDDMPPEDCERVALLRAAATARVVDRLREEAGRLGANAVDLRDFRHGAGDRQVVHDDGWNAVALHCPIQSGRP